MEFGAKDGVSFSNSYLLEKEFNWNGILGEPAKLFNKELPIHRSAYFEKNCLWSKSNHKLIFNEVSAKGFNGLSTISQFSTDDAHSKARKLGKEYEVITISLEDMLDKFKAPKLIDYLSIDTEGSEYEILKHFNFQKYKFKVITVEHNFTNQRNKINKLLCENGYKRKFEDISNFDDWYVLMDKNN